ncbi:uncharacterized protein SEPMUDRAFT_150880 [Sphaerulina musiva SO2202]|uniref:Uncharacterized protein n=1 Tax=Sphaerulina musiva (strain SO2202) TaxID=692275 RepID=N1QGF7_SPHMS|nr:uncharacterized protein SEPMUDRAFT_150880 [Sphaerulina musiva SO2202]EMF10932.1 hypothetical protein SEPMUDRAFT_150880 [Sphaerulina musiva SO2202]
MSPIARSAIKLTQKLRDSAYRTQMLDLVQEAINKPELAHFTVATFKNASHTSPSDPREHATVFLATEEQAKNNKAQAVHIYHDKDYKFTGYSLWQERENREDKTKDT